MGKRLDLTGKTFNHWTVIRYEYTNKTYGRTQGAFWLCRCVCGTEKTLPGSQVKCGASKSCGCQAKQLNRASQLMRTGACGELNQGYWGTVLKGARKRGLVVSITIEEAWKQFLKQKRMCALSGVPLRFTSCKTCHDGTASLDRIDNASGYTLNNIQWVHKWVNLMKADMQETEFFDWIRKLYSHHLNN